MKTLTDIRLLFWRRFTQSLRTPVFLFVSLTTPVAYLLLFMPLLDKLTGPGLSSGDVMQSFLPGMIALFFFSGSSFFGYGTIMQLKNGFIERMRVTPSSRFAILFGPILATAILMLVSMVIIVAASVPFGFEVYPAALLVFSALLVPMYVLFAAASAAFAIIMKGDLTGYGSVVSGITLPAMLLSGVMLPLSLAPEWMRVIAHGNPLYYVVEAGRLLAVGTINDAVVWTAFAVVVPAAALVLWWATRVHSKAIA